MAQHPKTVGFVGTKFFCMDPEVMALTQQQQAALHVCKHEMLAAIYRLYELVPVKTADDILVKHFAEIVKEMKP
jgi:hypothetical protein